LDRCRAVDSRGQVARRAGYTVFLRLAVYAPCQPGFVLRERDVVVVLRPFGREGEDRVGEKPVVGPGPAQPRWQMLRPRRQFQVVAHRPEAPAGFAEFAVGMRDSAGKDYVSVVPAI